MARYEAIAAAAAAIRGLLDTTWPRGSFESLTISICQAKDVEKGLEGDGIAILPWRVAINGQRRSRPPRIDALGNRFRPSLPIDLSIMIVPHAVSAEMQLRLLGWTMRALEDAGPFTANLLNEHVGGTDVFAPHEDAELICDPVSQADQLTLWDRMKKHPLAINYMMRLLLLDSDRSMIEAAPVIERQFDMGVFSR